MLQAMQQCGAGGDSPRIWGAHFLGSLTSGILWDMERDILGDSCLPLRGPPLPDQEELMCSGSITATSRFRGT